MPEDKRTRVANGRSSIFHSKSDGYWHGWISVGTKDNGKPDRRHVKGKTRTAVTKKVSALENARDNGRVRKAGQVWTVEQWLNHWLETIVAPPSVTINSFSAYEVAVRVHLVPGVGAHKLTKLQPEHLEKLYRKMMREGRAPRTPSGEAQLAKAATAHQVHRTIRAALNEAVRRKHITENPALIARAPQLDDEEVEPCSVAEVKRILEVADSDRNSARWAVALSLGLRQGEALGLKWVDIDLEIGTLIVRRNRLRPRWKHGCETPCGRKYGGHCPQRIALRKETADTKSRAGKRGMGLPDPLIELLKRHRVRQAHERDAACDLWEDSGYVFTTPVGRPLNPRSDYTAWKQLLERADVPERRLHDARHTAATVLLLLGVNERTTMAVMGWSSTSMAARYQHVIASIRREVADQIGGLIWNPTDPKPDDEKPESGAGGPSTAA